MSSAVENAVAHIWENYAEPLSLSEIARSAILSRFHFSRVFRDATGVSPGRFLSAVRIYQAKRLLVSTSLSVTEISLAVGYNSLGSFTNRFTESVGASPTQFRRLWDEGIGAAAHSVPESSSPFGTVAGRVEVPSDYGAARVYVAAFDTPIVQRQPSSWVIANTEPGGQASYRLANVPAGEWFIRAVTVADSVDPEPWTRRSLLVGGKGPLTVTFGAVRNCDICLHVRRLADLPILFAVPDLERRDTHHAFDAGAKPLPQTADLGAGGTGMVLAMRGTA